MRVPLLDLDAAFLAGRIDDHLVAMAVLVQAGEALQPGRLPRRGPFDRPQILGRQLVRMGKPALDEHVADQRP